MTRCKFSVPYRDRSEIFNPAIGNRSNRLDRVLVTSNRNVNRSNLLDHVSVTSNRKVYRAKNAEHTNRISRARPPASVYVRNPPRGCKFSFLIKGNFYSCRRVARPRQKLRYVISYFTKKVILARRFRRPRTPRYRFRLIASFVDKKKIYYTRGHGRLINSGKIERW